MKLLAKLVTGVCLAWGIAMGGAPAQAVTLVNGGFDLNGASPVKGKVNGNTFADLPTGATTNKTWDVFDSILGWTADPSTAGIEVQTKKTVGLKPHSGSYYLELDSDRGSKPGGTNSSMHQLVNLSAGQYLLEFYYSPRNDNTSSNVINYGIVGGPTGSITGPSGPVATKVGEWTLIEFAFAIDKPDDYKLFFAAAGKDDSLGGFIDSVSLSVVPAPVGIALLPFGFVAMHLIGRRRRAAA